MATYEGRARIVDAIQVTDSNLNEIVSKFGFTLSSGVLHDQKGMVVTQGTWICKFDDGVIKQLTADFFERIFQKVEPPTYKLPDMTDFTGEITRKSWNGAMKLKNIGVCFVLCEGDEELYPYFFTEADFKADDWMHVEET